jgi:hypothetical protein
MTAPPDPFRHGIGNLAGKVHSTEYDLPSAPPLDPTSATGKSRLGGI